MIEANIVPITSENCYILGPAPLFMWIMRQLADQDAISLDSEGTGMCRYRTVREGKVLKCAAGFCITDDAYNMDMEGDAIRDGYLSHTKGDVSLVNEYLYRRFSNDQIVAIKVAQLVHDYESLPVIHALAESTDVITFEALQEALAAHKRHYCNDITMSPLLKAINYLNIEELIAGED